MLNVPCVNCGALRFSPHELKKNINLMCRNVLFKSEQGTQWIIGVCQECLDKDSYDYDKVSSNLYKDQKACLTKYKLPLSSLAQLEGLKFVSHQKQCS